MDDVLLRFHRHQKLEAHAIGRQSRWRTVICIGGVGSGKTLMTAYWLLDRGRWDVEQLHGLFASTGPQLHAAILGEALPWVEAAGVDAVFGRRPPKDWLADWQTRGIRPPRLKRYTNILSLSSGLTVYCGSMGTKSYRQTKGLSFGSALIEEACHGAPEEGVRFVLERIRCGKPKETCQKLHRHVLILHGNPPDDDGHWIYDLLNRWESETARKAGRPDRASDDSYPCLLEGIGDQVYIPSRTTDNREFLGDGYIEDLTASVDEETAQKVLHGALTRSRRGRVYNAFDTSENEREIRYDPNRTLYVGLDFNVNPTVAIFGHQLNPGEYPSQHDRPGITHIGIFGEYFHIGGQDVSGLCAALLAGDSGSAGHLPSNWQGLLAHTDRAIFFGDATATWQKAAGNEWQLVDDIVGKAIKGRYARNVPDRNPLVPIGVRAVNAKFKAANGLRSLWIHPRCSQLIEDLMTCTWDKGGRDIQKFGYRPGSSSKLWQRGHLSDALRYVVSKLFPMGYEATQPITPRIAPRSTFRMPRIR